MLERPERSNLSIDLNTLVDGVLLKITHVESGTQLLGRVHTPWGEWVFHDRGVQVFYDLATYDARSAWPFINFSDKPESGFISPQDHHIEYATLADVVGKVNAHNNTVYNQRGQEIPLHLYRQGITQLPRAVDLRSLDRVT